MNHMCMHTLVQLGEYINTVCPHATDAPACQHQRLPVPPCSTIVRRSSSQALPSPRSILVNDLASKLSFDMWAEADSNHRLRRSPSGLSNSSPIGRSLPGSPRFIRTMSHLGNARSVPVDWRGARSSADGSEPADEVYAHPGGMQLTLLGNLMPSSFLPLVQEGLVDAGWMQTS